MDIDAFTVAHREQWHRLDQLITRRHLTGAQADELITLYRATARDLARVRTEAPDPQVVTELSQRVAAARARITGTREMRVTDLARFVTVTMPLALYRLRWWSAAVLAVEILLAAITAVWTLHTPEALADLGSRTQRYQYAHSLFESYYSTYQPSDFAALVWTNNARLAAICVAGGITGIVPAYILWANALSVGQAAAIMSEHDMLHVFFALITPHGLLELTCLFMAGAAGLKLFWTMLVPGPRSRSQALAEEGKNFATVALAMTVALGVSGLIEAFVTPAPVPWVLKIAVGVSALALLWVYTLVLGRHAVEETPTDLSEDEAGAYLPVAG